MITFTNSSVAILGVTSASLAALKMTNVIDCPWWLVVAPLWTPFASTAALIGLFVGIRVAIEIWEILRMRAR